MQTLGKCRSGIHRIYGLAAVMIAAILAVSLAMPQSASAAPGIWSPTGSLKTAREWHTATPLVDGRVLVAGGFANNITASAELYNPATGTWTDADNLSVARHSHTATLLDDGRVLVVGGYGVSAPLSSAQRYNPGTGHWENTNPLTTARYLHTATRLADGRVLVAGGENNISGRLSSAQIYNPATGTWANTGSLATARYGHTATLLADGRVLVAGGYDNSDDWTASAEIFNPVADGGFGAWSGTGSLGTARYYHTATLLTNGRVLVAGGTGHSMPAIAELFDPAADGGFGDWSDAGSTGTGRYHHTATLLDDGRVLVAGGYNGSYLAITQYYSPEAGAWTNTGSLGIGRRKPTATLLPDGRVLVAGGFGNSSYLASAEVFTTRPGSLAGLWLLLDD
jgi:hypothetical protein